MNLSNELADYWIEAARTAAGEFIHNAECISENPAVKAYFKKNKHGGSYWLEIREPRPIVRLVDIEIQKAINPITLRARIWYYSGEPSLPRRHKELGLVSLGNEEIRCSEIDPRESWLRQLAVNGVAVEGVEYPLRKVEFLNSESEIGSGLAAILNDLWSVSLQIENGNVVAAKNFFPEEIGELESMLYEGAISKVNVNKFERNRRAREQCIDHFGSECQVCHIEFGELYGEIGAGFIHVHHLVQLSSIGETYAVNPIQDLVPVCPNCHAMLHQRNPPLSIEELRARCKCVNIMDCKKSDNHENAKRQKTVV
ncbi:HNH endonuclease [Candidatus Thiodictyon syntrophicum]|jgi:hypothetical protein|uniref:HNH domain-containing protein n=1 Tax=Candidatus Thiodictyon syntrophicum TaxID=1166950 RepID=A0A2K8UIH2_9GAMM|nr:HNH endonuclease [Candidatus Thiodictyon syntrophicum]AUB85279.1 hypothetical protein THSYN_30715 [Candidatus Thiodictyon syntrophicum]